MKRFLVALLALCMIFSLVACSTPATTSTAAPDSEAAPASQAAAGSDVTLGVLIYKFADTYIGTVRDAITKYADEMGVAIDMQDGQEDQGKQNDELDAMLNKGEVDAILVNIVDVGAAADVATKIKDAGVPYIFFNREPDADVYADALFVGTTPSEAGVMQGDLMADLWDTDMDKLDLNGDGNVQFLVFKGNADNPEAIARTDYSISQMESRGYTLDNLNGDPLVCDWDTAKAHDAMEQMWAAHQGEIEAIFCNNDGMAIGVISALNAVGYNTGEDDSKWIPIVGVDATAEGLEAIKNGQMYATVKQDGDAMGKALVILGVNAANGAAVPYTDGTDYTAEADNSVRIPYAPVDSVE